MQLTAEALIVSLVMILPGFVAILISDYLAYRLRGQDNTQDRTLPTFAMKSITISIFINAIALVIFIVILGYVIDMTRTLENAKDLTTGLRVRDFFFYLGTLYLIAVIIGSAMGTPRDGFWHYLHGKGWTSIAPTPDVWTGATAQIYETIDGPRDNLPANQRVLWLQVELEKDRHLYGILRRSSVRIDHDKAFEAFLSSPIEVDPDRGQHKAPPSGLTHRGVYLHITPDMRVHMFTGRVDWTPPLAAPILAAEPFTYQGNAVYCRGVVGTAGHPGVYVAIERSGTATCPYCNQRYNFPATS